MKELYPYLFGQTSQIISLHLQLINWENSVKRMSSSLITEVKRMPPWYVVYAYIQHSIKLPINPCHSVLSTVKHHFTLTLTMLATGRVPHDAKDFQALVT
jgi:hypothetical protein